MRVMFGVLSLLTALAVVMVLARHQAVPALATPLAQQSRPGAPAQGTGATAAAQAKALQDKARDDTTRALQEGSDRLQRAEQN